MYYDALSSNTVKITLTRKDMSDYSIKSESLRSRSAESKRSLTRFLKKFQSESSLFQDQSAERLFLEAFPQDDGGCVMYVSTLGIEPLGVSEPVRRTRTMMCSAGSFSDIARLGACIAGKTSSSVLCRYSGSYCLIVRTSAVNCAEVSRLIEEYGELSDDPTDIACAEEHGNIICARNAARVISELL